MGTAQKWNVENEKRRLAATATESLRPRWRNAYSAVHVTRRKLVRNNQIISQKRIAHGKQHVPWPLRTVLRRKGNRKCPRFPALPFWGFECTSPFPPQFCTSKRRPLNRLR